MKDHHFFILVSRSKVSPASLLPSKSQNNRWSGHTSYLFQSQFIHIYIYKHIGRSKWPYRKTLYLYHSQYKFIQLDDIFFILNFILLCLSKNKKFRIGRETNPKRHTSAFLEIKIFNMKKGEIESFWMEFIIVSTFKLVS